MPIFASFVTIFVGFFADSIFYNWMNWPGAGAVFAVATMGAFLLWTLREKKRDDGPEDGQG